MSLSSKARLYSRVSQYPTQKDKFLKSIEAVAQRCSVRKGVLRNFTKFTGKHLWQSLFFNKVAGLRPATLLKKRLWHRCFPVKFAKFLRTPFLTEHLQWLLLKAPNFISVARFCAVQNTSNYLEKAHLRKPFLQNSGCFQMSVTFLKKGKTETIFHTSSELNTLEIL